MGLNYRIQTQDTDDATDKIIIKIEAKDEDYTDSQEMTLDMIIGVTY